MVATCYSKTLYLHYVFGDPKPSITTRLDTTTVVAHLPTVLTYKSDLS